METWLEQLTRDGYTLLRGVLSPAEVENARNACSRAFAQQSAAGSLLTNKAGAAYGARNLLEIWPDVVRFMRLPKLAAPLSEILGSDGGLVRGLYFDKPPGATWSLPWHRDLTIAVKQHGPLGDLKKPTIKAGVPHMEAPVDLLAGMVTARIHLDAMTTRNGPLQVLPGSHRLDETDHREAVVIQCEAGDVLLMRPLLSHSSIESEAECREHRRIVHLEFGPTEVLPDGYEWHDFVALA